MSEHGHDLHAAFPDDHDILVALKTDSAKFRELWLRYHALNEEIFNLDAGLDAGADERLEALKKERLVSLDEVASMIATKRQAEKG
ncbi:MULTISPECIES: YdcH family protein [unclassified Sphingomonas]|uniref:YdcH family protein n=1 Tax=unclassified Sphingomonas TaxID=196159 RepID=UPI0006F232EF|nr:MULTISPECIES: DUF465 domain-containing protein [unclassified Sphingomonas]KQX23299.1 hypothetical protein ASD17_03005 [Sphingomonas sp. Root1294]KQY68147.1 hypothetical protein ASD39_05525 [Sphingomonas sp. Root50]KRB91040.1 hypothetical protein ASE22_12320 [Sphingomonas sp. Root720]